MIVEEEQNKTAAEYGKRSQRVVRTFNREFVEKVFVENLCSMRRFYMVYLYDQIIGQKVSPFEKFNKKRGK